jgi:hypothetical protein
MPTWRSATKNRVPYSGKHDLFRKTGIHFCGSCFRPVPHAISFATKPTYHRDLIGAALDTDVSCAWVLAAPRYDSASRLRRMVEEHRFTTFQAGK